MTANIWKDYEPGQEALLRSIADGLHEFANEVVAEVRAAAPPHTSKRPRAYRESIRATTYLRGEVIAGETLTLIDQRREIYSIVYTSSSLGHMLEFGTKPHIIPTLLTHGHITYRNWRHPGAQRRPHFVPGLLSARSRLPAAMTRGARASRVMVNTRVL